MTATRHEIVSLAEWFIRKNGYNAFSYRDIALKMQIRNAAIHHYFPAKSDLGIAVVEEEIKKVALSKENNMDLSAAAQIKSLVEGFYSYGERGLICLTGSLTPEFNTLPPPLQVKVTEMCHVTLDWLANCLEKARLEKDLHFQGTAADRAHLLVTALLSSLVLSRVMGIGVFERMMDQVLRDMGASWR
jgi:TetR/AcrR family transcriptional regulator, transcriptional repressor for nem operon